LTYTAGRTGIRTVPIAPNSPQNPTPITDQNDRGIAVKNVPIRLDASLSTLAAGRLTRPAAQYLYSAGAFAAPLQHAFQPQQAEYGDGDRSRQQIRRNSSG
jgi:hypothetical protein